MIKPELVERYRLKTDNGGRLTRREIGILLTAYDEQVVEVKRVAGVANHLKHLLQTHLKPPQYRL
jgi:hypothetical protein